MVGNKTATYLGFALRARKLTLGVNAIKALKGEVYLLVADSSASTNAQKEIMKLKARFSCPLTVVENLEDLTGKAFCKLAAVREENLARAVLGEAGETETFR